MRRINGERLAVNPVISAPSATRRGIILEGERRGGMRANEITEKIIGAAIQVHREMGPGLLESVYQRCLEIELSELGLKCERELAVPVAYKGRTISDDGLRLDLLVEASVIVEVKSVEELKSVHSKQLLTYLRLMDKRVGLLVNFGTVVLKDGIIRIVNKFAEG